ncbi:MAG TPA: molybdopterin molybdotransferase MoeA [bacterium]|nr:molybdopterin molybdotransferase MoeA [bacterium]
METGRPVISFREAFEKVSLNIPPFEGTEIITLDRSCGRILAENIHADRDIPPFNRSAVDGFAIRAEDIGRSLKVIEFLAAGAVTTNRIEPGTCIKIMTGAAVPEGAEQIIMVEYSNESNGSVSFNIPEKEIKSRNYSFRGEDMKKGDMALSSGIVISPKHIATLASLGRYEFKVKRKPVIGIIATGDEIVEPWEDTAQNSIRNANGWELVAQIERAGGFPFYAGIVKDDMDSIKEAIEITSRKCDMVLITGGVSMGDYDLAGKAIRELGYEVLFDSVAVKPGKPVTFAIKTGSNGEKDVLLGLPGNPLSVFVIFEIMVRPCIEKMLGIESFSNDIYGYLASDFQRKKGEREEWVPAKILPDGKIEPLKYHGSGHFHILSVADAIFRIERTVLSLREGEKVSVRYI